MTHPQRNHKEQGSSFTITQFALGSPLQFEPALGSQELDNLISNYVPGSARPQQKRAQVVLEFLNSIDALAYSHPVSIRYHVPQVFTPLTMPCHSSMPSLNTPSPRTITPNEEALNTSKSTSSLKRSLEEVATPNTSSAKRLPGFSIMTRDGIDITDLASRGPKTKEQRDHAALMRKLKACAACKKSKQRCDPSHHRHVQTALSTPTPSSATSSNRSARFSCVSPTGGSRGSISPQSSLGESFSQSPSQTFSDRAIAQAGQSFPPFSIAKPSLSPSDFTLPDNLLTGSDLSAFPMQDFDPELFQLADMELDSWNAGFTAFPSADNHYAWNSHEDIFAPSQGYGLFPQTQGGIPSEQVRPGSSPQVTTPAEQVVSRQDHQERLTYQPGQLLRDAYPESHGVEFDVDQRLHSNTAQEDRNESQTLLSAAAASGRMFKHDPLQKGSHDPVLSRDEDYILYPDSPHIEWGLEPHLISHDIGDKQWLSRKGAGSGTLRKRHIEKSSNEQDSKEPASAEVRISGSQKYSSTRPRSIDTLSKKMTTIITLCILMTVSLLWTMSLLMTASNNPMKGRVAKQGDITTLNRFEPEIAYWNCQNDVRPISFGHDIGSPCQSDSGPGPDYTVSDEDFLYSGSDHVFDIESNPILEPRSVAETHSADVSLISEDYFGHWSEQPTPSPTFSSLSGTAAFTTVPSTTNCATAWTTHLPARPTPQPKEAHIPVTLHNQRHSYVRSPPSRILPDRKRSWSRRFNIGHLTARITSLTIL